MELEVEVEFEETNDNPFPATEHPLGLLISGDWIDGTGNLEDEILLLPRRVRQNAAVNVEEANWQWFK